MFVDASALVAILAGEAEAEQFADKIEKSGAAITSALSVFEAALAVVRLRRSSVVEARLDVADFLAESGTQLVAVAGREAESALAAFEAFGKGRHRAGLNMGDCFSYACAKTQGVPLLFKGDDFIHTDIQIA